MHSAKIQKMGLTVKKSLMELAVLWACLEQTCLPGRSWEGLCIASFVLRWALGRDTALTPLESTACNPRAPYVAEQLLRIRGVQTLHWKALSLSWRTGHYRIESPLLSERTASASQTESRGWGTLSPKQKQTQKPHRGSCWLQFWN